MVDVRGLHGHDLTPGHIVFVLRAGLLLSLFTLGAFNVVASSSQDKGSGGRYEGGSEEEREKEHPMTLSQSDKTGSEHARGRVYLHASKSPIGIADRK